MAWAPPTLRRIEMCEIKKSVSKSRYRRARQDDAAQAAQARSDDDFGLVILQRIKSLTQRGPEILAEAGNGLRGVSRQLMSRPSSTFASWIANSAFVLVALVKKRLNLPRSLYHRIGIKNCYGFSTE
jgi:hypothetical protein